MANEFVARNGIISLDGGQITGSLRVTQGVTASLFGTASWALNSTTASFVLNAVSSSFAATASFIATSSLASNFFSQGGNSFGALALLGTNDNQALAFETNGSEKMRLAATRNNFLVNQTGSLGGVTASIELSGNGINDSTEQASYQIYANHGTFAANTGYFVFNKSRGTTQGAVTAVASGDRLGMIRWNGADGASQVRAAEIYAEVDGAVSTNDMPGRLIFATTLDGASIPTERMRITNAGSVGINSTSPAFTLDVGGDIKSSANIRSSNGTVTTAISWQTGPTYGIVGTFSNHDLSIWTNNSQKMIITAAGNVGIGTTSPTAITNYVAQTINGTAGSFTEYQENGTNTFRVGSDASLGGFIYTQSTLGIRFGTNNIERMRIFSDGNVGIGTTVASARLHVSGTTGGVFEVDGAAAVNALYVSASGIVGIGTTSPVNTLHVVGSGRFTDSLAVSTAVSTGDAFIELGTGRSASGNAYIDLVGDTTYTDFALRIIRGSAGANATSQIIHRGTGAFSIIAQDAASLALSTSNSARLTILSGGSIGIGTTTVGSLLQVNGNTAIGYAASTAAPTNGLTVSGSVGIGTTVAPWASTFRVLQLGARTTLFNSDINFTGLYNNLYYDGAAYRYLTTAAGSSIELGGGVITFGTVASGTAGNTAAGSERMRITNGGNIGIGTTAPAALLHVSGSVSGSTFQAAGTGRAFFTQNVGTNSVWAEFINTGGNFYVGRDNSTGTSFGTGTAYSAVFYESGANPMVFFTNASQRMRIASDGNVGIGTTSPVARLHVSGTVGGVFQVNGAAAVNALYVSASGNVGIATTSPSQKLDVVGRLKFRSDGALTSGVWFTGNTGTEDVFVGLQDLSSTSAWGVYSASSWRFTILNGGNVGIGTTSPSHKLQVIGAVPANEAISNIISLTDSSSNTGYLGIARSSSTENGTALTSDGKLVFRVGSTTEAMTIRSSGNVGIGTTSPLNALEVGANGNIKLKGGAVSFDNSLNTHTFSISVNASPALIFTDVSNATERMRITSGGNVGIGTTNPSIARLQIIAAGSGFVHEKSSNQQFYGTGFNGNNGYFTYYTDSNFIFGYGTSTGGVPSVSTLTLTTGGSVGIGITSPQAPLHVIASSSADNALIQEWSYTAANADVYSLMLKQTVTSGVVRYNFSMVNNSTAYNDVLVLDRGSVIIGGTNTSYKLHVVSAPGSILALGEESFTTGKQLLIGINASANTEIQAVHQGTAYKDLLLNPSGGNVGIGTTTTAAKLDINGDIQTDSPSGGSKKPWKLGNVAATSVVLDENNYVEVEINGTAYKLALVNPA